jgi:hypothetical protein
MPYNYAQGTLLETQRPGHCIVLVQDSEEDWASESSQMARIYKDCLVMIAFSGYENSHQPILCPRPHVNTCELGDNLKGVFFQSNLRSGLHDDPQSNLGTSPCPLSRRGWAFQERLLAPRTLHYTAEQLIWECTKFSVSESGRWGSRQEYVIPARVNGESKNKYYSLWRQLVQNYTLRELTYPDDRFPALSGVASEIRGRKGLMIYISLDYGEMTFIVVWFGKSTEVAQQLNTVRHHGVGHPSTAVYYSRRKEIHIPSRLGLIIIMTPCF